MVPTRGVGLARSEIRELLERLVEQSLVSIHISADTVRYYLLESLRLFASNRLAERSTEHSDEPARLPKRHCYHYRNKVLHAQAEWFGPAEQELLNWAHGAWSNIWRAIDTSMAVGKPRVGLQIGIGLMSVRAHFRIRVGRRSRAASSGLWRPRKYPRPSRPNFSLS